MSASGQTDIRIELLKMVMDVIKLYNIDNFDYSCIENDMAHALQDIDKKYTKKVNVQQRCW